MQSYRDSNGVKTSMKQLRNESRDYIRHHRIRTTFQGTINLLLMGDIDENANYKSEEDQAQNSQIDKIDIAIPSIAQVYKNKLFELVDTHVVFASVGIICILNDVATALIVVMVVLYLVASLLVILCETKSIWIRIAPNTLLLTIYISYLVIDQIE